MSLDKLFAVAGSAMTAQSQRLNVVASNLANADSATGNNGKPYQAKQVVFSSVPVAGETVQGVRVANVLNDPSPMKQVYDPKHPLANEQGYVTMPNVDVIEEMVNMISASRSYQNNAEIFNTAKALIQKTLSLGE